LHQQQRGRKRKTQKKKKKMPSAVEWVGEAAFRTNPEKKQGHKECVRARAYMSGAKESTHKHTRKAHNTKHTARREQEGGGEKEDVLRVTTSPQYPTGGIQTENTQKTTTTTTCAMFVVLVVVVDDDVCLCGL